MEKQPKENIHPKKKICFIVNPHAGVARDKKIEGKIPKILDLQKFDYVIEYTQHAGHATDLAAAAVAADYDIIVAVGGDGSVNEVSKALIGTDKILGILPAGSGNGLATYLGLGRNINQAIKYLNDDSTLLIDTCQVNDRHYVNLAGVGFDAIVSYKMKQTNFRGLLGYLWIGLKEAWSFQFPKLKITIDGKTIERECLVVEVANAPMFGYNFLIAPQAKLNDGVLDIVVFKKFPKWRYFLSGWRFFNGTFHKSSLTETYIGKSVVVEVNNKQSVHVDGEGYIANRNLNFSIKPLSLRVITPNASKFSIS